MALVFDEIQFFSGEKISRLRSPQDIGDQVLARLMKLVAAEPNAVIAPESWRSRWATRLEWLSARLRGNEPPTRRSGKLLSFHKAGSSLGYPVYSVLSVRGGMRMGKLEWSNQWNRARFKADPEAIFDQQCVAEIYAMMKELR